MSDDDFDELPEDVNVFTGKSYDQINNFFNDDLETVDFQSTIAPSTGKLFHFYKRRFLGTFCPIIRMLQKWGYFVILFGEFLLM